MSTVGRPHIDGSAAGTAPRLERITISISAEDAEYLRYIGGGYIGKGNISAGVRYLVDGHRRLMDDVRKAATTQP